MKGNLNEQLKKLQKRGQVLSCLSISLAILGVLLSIASILWAVLIGV